MINFAKNANNIKLFISANLAKMAFNAINAAKFCINQEIKNFILLLIYMKRNFPKKLFKVKKN